MDGRLGEELLALCATREVSLNQNQIPMLNYVIGLEGGGGLVTISSNSFTKRFSSGGGVLGTEFTSRS